MGSEDLEQFWLVANVVWIAQKITSDNIKKVQLVTTLQDRVLTWYIKFYQDKPSTMLVETQQAFSSEFKKPKSQAQCVTEFKEIHQKVNESSQDFDQSLKFLIRHANMTIMDDQHKDWYVASLLPHPRFPLSQQKIGTQVEVVEIMMRLESLPIKDMNVGVQHIQSQLEILHMELHSLKTRKESQPKVRTDVQCIKCKDEGHDNNHYPVYHNYLIGGGLVPLKLDNTAGPSTGVLLWCDIFQITGKHTTDNCHLLQNFVQTPHKLFCTFCKSVGHDERNCQSYELMMERTPTY